MLFPVVVGRAKRHRIRTVYAPKGNLSRIEFTRARDVKKFVYLCLIEGVGLRMCNTLMLSSKVERDNLLPPRWSRPPMEIIAAEPFLPVELPVRLSPPFSDRRKHCVLGFIAEIAPRKGLLELAEGFVRWVDERQLDDVELWIAGEPRPGSAGYWQTCRDVLAALEERGLVRWLGAQRGEARTHFYGSIDALMVPSQLESYGLTALESLAHGRPVVCAPRVGVLEYLPHSPAVIRLPDLAPAAFLAAFDELLLTDTEGYEAAVSGMIEEIFTDPFQEKITDQFFHALAITS